MMRKNEISDDNTDDGNDKCINSQSRRRATQWRGNQRSNGEKIKEQAIGTKIYNAIGTKSKTQWGQNQRGNGEEIKDRAIGRVVVDL